MTESPTTRRASLEVLRAEAADELAVLVQERLLGGEDPWEFMEELPRVDELVVFLLRADEIVESGGVRPDEARNFEVLRRIAIDYPELTRIVWGLLGDGPKYRRWDLLTDDAHS
ncbi:tryptophan synthase subunit alpha [Microbacterium capsulatum]|uniref:Tryptophan synthase subunit alpha n=1 Tax=Microbacterium capsulatum TaxID=3041921 RepID=A0ABU0XI56_9MICO|nr:tryptophan synthase subunit alpha [Microbacterium sp. ASV81]MDQ4214817.1 tryptophan synthase subunit alpha [Microbacterium sp. ASV81]